jgi:hypothetical protein
MANQKESPAHAGEVVGDDPLSRIARELASLGAETPGERQVKRVAPWVFSLVIHFCLVLLALLITWSVSQVPKRDEAVLIVADFNALNYDPVAKLGGAESGGSTGPTQALDRVQTLSADKAVRDQLSVGQSDVTGLLAGTTGAGTPALSGFAPRGGGGGTGASFAGTSSTNARRIVYVIDASGSMISHMQIVVDELSRSLEALTPKQSFNVVFFQQNKALAAPPANQLLVANEQEKIRSLQWIRDNIVPQGRSNPLAALELAINLKPDVIFVLSEGITGSGEFEIDQRDLLARLNELNPRNSSGQRKIQINCVQFLEPDPLDTLKIIAQQHGGTKGYKFLSRQELGLGGGT